MCLATPLQLVRVSGNQGFVEHAGGQHKVRLDLIENPQEGDWLLCHADLAVNRLTEEEAREILLVIGSCPHG